MVSSGFSFLLVSSRLVSSRVVFIIYKCVNEERDAIHSSERAFSSFVVSSTFVFSVLEA